jgi:hypothetical protein
MRNWIWWVGVTAIVIAGGFYAVRLEDVQPAHLSDSLLRKGDRIYLLTGQWRSRFINLSSRSSEETITDLLVDVWAFDANTAAPVWRKRLYEERGGAMQGFRILGAEGDTLWALVKGGLRAVSLTDGRVLADRQALESRNEGLQGLLPSEQRYYRFDDTGLHFKAADGREWWLDGSLSAHLSAPGGNRDLAPTSYYTPSHAASFRSRGLLIDKRWLGLLNEEEAKTFEKNGAIGGLDYESRRRLWSARTSEGTNFFGTYLEYHDFKPLGPDFLAPALLAEHRPTGPDRVLWYRNPDSLLILHRDRLGEMGKLRLSRVAGPEGRVLWQAQLPMSMLQCVMSGERSVVLVGVEYQPASGQGPRDPMHGASELLLSVDLSDGRVSTHDFSAIVSDFD